MSGAASGSRGAARVWLPLALVLFVLGAERLVRATPMFEAPDENAHAEYVGIVLWSGETPLVLGTAAEAGRPGWLQTALGHHPSLYYRLLAGGLALAGHRDLSLHAEFHGRGGATRVEHGADELDPPSPAIAALRWMRRFSILCGALSLVAVHAALRAAAPGEPHLAGLGSLWLATNGGWLRTHAVLDNGNLSLAATLGLVALLAHAVRRERLGLGVGLAAGLLAGLALATKLTALACPALVLCAGVWIAWRRDRRPWVLPAGALVALLLAGLAVAPWVGRNLALYGEPLATAVHEAAYAINVLPDEARLEHLWVGLPRGVLRTAAGPIGWSLLNTPAWAEVALAATFGLALVGWTSAALARSAGAGPDAATRGASVALAPAPTWLLALAALAALALLVRFNLVFAQPQARYAYTAAPFAAGFVGGGLLALGRRLPARARAGAVLAVVALALVGELAFLGSTARAFAGAIDADRRRPLASLDLHGPPTEVVAPAPELERRPDGPVRLTWEAGRARWSAVLWVEDGPRFGGTWQTLGRALEGGRFELPAPVWDYLEPGQELSLALRRLPPSEGAARRSAGSDAGTSVARVRR